ncbi:DPP6 N-TERMINAL DOMAIN-LIKE PROTEIN [Salix purpurea]|uniref:DPP6 N-TERMINAL DOMAIN-LIKE PROTEIN n=1 Tax=Salix purpurea TaxID=77065 RepID=A0A9Q0PCP7_SALPP|nr:DPP6 N-TERMINAL DOMAIN-LIKE PROTEIN [Salix purpurea]
MKPIKFLSLLLHFSLVLFHATVAHEPPPSGTSIIFATLGRLDYAFDIFTLPTGDPPSKTNELQITDGQQNPPPLNLIYVTERGGSSNIFYDAVYVDTPRSARSRSALEIPTRVQVPLLNGKGGLSMKDKPTVSGDYLVYVSTHEDPGEPRTSWAAVYATELTTGFTRRLTPHGIADFSPAVSPSGVYTAVASYGEKGWSGEVEELSTDIYIFLTCDGTNRVKVVEHGGWPNWVDESTLYFHRRSVEDNWISVYKATLPSQGPISIESVIVERVTPPGLHAFTPATSPELFDLAKNEFIQLTRLVSPQTHHLNPFISPDSARVGYHRCRGATSDKKSTHLLLENVKSPLPDISLFRIDGSFPSFAPAGDRIAYVDFPGLYVVNRDGSNRKQVFTGMAFSTAWNPARKGIVYTSAGPTFASESTEVDIISINVDDDLGQINSFKKLTSNGENNAFPAVSPDGKWVVFRSGRSGHKNLYIMDALEGEKGGLYRLTEGPWSDTMSNWSPDGEWIAFASDRESPGSGSFELFLIHPNGTGLRKLVQSGSAGRANHPCFSPDGNSIVFTSDYGGISAEPISNPHHYQPYGEIFTVKLDGSDLKRLTHNSYEDGTPAWGPTYIKPKDVEWPGYGPQCSFEECYWLNKMPVLGHGAAPWDPTRPQCGSASP